MELSKGDIVYAPVFDNGDGPVVQPEDQNEKYSRALFVHKIDPEGYDRAGSEYGKERGDELLLAIVRRVSGRQEFGRRLLGEHRASLQDRPRARPDAFFRRAKRSPLFEMHLKGGYVPADRCAEGLRPLLQPDGP